MMMRAHPIRDRHALGVDDADLIPILFPARITLNEHCWVSSAERRSVLRIATEQGQNYAGTYT
jgi:hypothetical protein